MHRLVANGGGGAGECGGFDLAIGPHTASAASVNAQALCQRRRERVEVLEAIPVARDEARAGSIDFQQRAKAIVLKLEQPTVVVESLGAALHDKRRDSRQGAHCVGRSMPLLAYRRCAWAPRARAAGGDGGSSENARERAAISTRSSKQRCGRRAHRTFGTGAPLV